MGNNLYSNLVNFYNVNDESFKEFMANLYKEMLTTHRDVQYVKEHLTEEIEKKLEIYLIDGKFNINIEEKVNEFLENNQEIKNINLELDNITQEVEKPITLDKCDSEMIGAIQNKEGETTFNLLSIPRDSSVNLIKLDHDIKNTLYSSVIIDDSQVERKGTVGATDLYIINNNFENCVISSITLSCLGDTTGEVRIYERNGDIVTLVESITFDTRVLGTSTPKIDVNRKVDNGYIGFTRGIGSINFGSKNTFGLLNCNGKKAETIFDISTVELFDNFSMKVLIETNKINIVTKDELKNNISKINNSYITVDKNGNGDYTTIQEAINNYNGIPIFVRNGIYEEGRIECSDKDITIIGEDKYRTIIKNKNGLYEEDCLYCSNGIFSNLQFISEYVNGESTEINQQNGAYAVHVDSNNQANGTCVFNDCIIISDFNAAVGAGLRKNNTVEFNNCDLISRQYNRGQEFANGGMGALFVHNNHTGTGDNCPNQVLRLNNCRLKAKLKNVIRIQEISKNNAEAILDINNCLIYSETNGVTGVIKYGNVNSFNEMNIWRLSNTSYGNTVKELNKL